VSIKKIRSARRLKRMEADQPEDDERHSADHPQPIKSSRFLCTLTVGAPVRKYDDVLRIASSSVTSNGLHQPQKARPRITRRHEFCRKKQEFLELYYGVLDWDASLASVCFTWAASAPFGFSRR